jgi:hypothetical protein
MMFLPPGKHPFTRFESVFTFLDYVTPDWSAYEEAILDFANRAVAKGVSYVEFTTSASPDLFALIERVEKRTGLVLRVNRSFSRENTPGELDQRLTALLALAENPRLVGIDILANESNAPALEKGQLLYGRLLGEVQAGRSKLHRTMHAGELGDLRNPRDAMILGAERLGHGVNLAHDPVALEYAARNHIAVEVNLSSNLRLTSVERLAEHPYLDYLRLGLPVSLSTDDEGIFDTDIAHECELAIAETDVTYAEFKTMAFNSIRTSFASDSDKQVLTIRLERAFADFERKQAFPETRERHDMSLQPGA